MLYAANGSNLLDGAVKRRRVKLLYTIAGMILSLALAAVSASHGAFSMRRGSASAARR